MKKENFKIVFKTSDFKQSDVLSVKDKIKIKSHKRPSLKLLKLIFKYILKEFKFKKK